MSTIKTLRSLTASLMWAWALTCSFVDGAQPTQQDPKPDAKPSESQTQEPATQEPANAPKQEPISADAKSWALYEPAESRASFKMPVKPSLKQRMYTPVEGQPPIKIHNYLGVFNDDKGLLLFNYHDLYQKPGEAAVEETLKLAMLESISSLGGRLISEQKIRYRTNPGRTFEFRFAREKEAVFYKGIARVFLVGNRQYQVAVMMEEDKFDLKISDAFLNSLRLIEPEPESKEGTESTQKDSTEDKTNLPESETKPESDSTEDGAEPKLKLPLGDDGVRQ